MKNYSLLAIPFFLSFGALAHAQSYENYRGDRGDRGYGGAYRPTQLVKYYKPTQTYYGNGYVVRYGYATTTPGAAGYIHSYAHLNATPDQFLTVANSETRRDITLVKKTVNLPAKEDQQGKRDIQPAPVKQQAKPQSQG